MKITKAVYELEAGDIKLYLLGRPEETKSVTGVLLIKTDILDEIGKVYSYNNVDEDSAPYLAGEPLDDTWGYSTYVEKYSLKELDNEKGYRGRAVTIEADDIDCGAKGYLDSAKCIVINALNGSDVSDIPLRVFV